MEAEIKVGDILYDLDLQDYKVTRVGKKYLHVGKGYREINIEKQTLKHIDKQYSQRNFTLYKNKEDVISFKEKSLKRSKVVEAFYFYSSSKVTDDQILAIYKILFSDKEN